MSQSVEYSLIKTNLPNSKEPYGALIKKAEAVDKNKLVEIMADKGSTLTRTDIEGVLNLFYETVIQQLRQGRVVSTPLFRAELSLKGSFKTHKERFNPNKHKAHVVIRPAKGLNRIATGMLHFRRSKDEHSVFNIAKLLVLSPEKDAIYPGSVIQLKGKSLKTYNTKAEYAVELYQDNVLVAEAPMITHSAGQVTATIPYDLMPGLYYIGFSKSFGGKRYTTGMMGLRVMERGLK
ncbi:MAG: hypothetical protein JXR70_19180 [Spirochaetales bacterium]|nr:hypothetical protein [Spirochaetales bacterium]